MLWNTRLQRLALQPEQGATIAVWISCLLDAASPSCAHYGMLDEGRACNALVLLGAAGSDKKADSVQAMLMYCKHRADISDACSITCWSDAVLCNICISSKLRGKVFVWCIESQERCGRGKEPSQNNCGISRPVEVDCQSYSAGCSSTAETQSASSAAKQQKSVSNPVKVWVDPVYSSGTCGFCS